MLTRTNSLMAQIAQVVFGLIPAGWITATVTTSMVTGFAEQDSIYFFEEGGPEHSFASGDETFELLEELREAMYETSPAQGAWYVAILSLTANGKFSYKFDYEDTTQFEVVPDLEDFEADLIRFPRET